MPDTQPERGFRNDRNLHTYGTYARARVNVHIGQPFLSFLSARWNVMVMSLAGEPLPPLPPIPGRVHRAPDPEGDDPELIAREQAQRWVWVALAEGLP